MIEVLYITIAILFGILTSAIQGIIVERLKGKPPQMPVECVWGIPTPPADVNRQDYYRIMNCRRRIKQYYRDGRSVDDIARFFNTTRENIEHALNA